MQDLKEMIKPCKNLFLVEGLSLVDTGFDMVGRQVHKPHMSFDPRLTTGLSLWLCEKLLFAMSSTRLLSICIFLFGFVLPSSTWS